MKVAELLGDIGVDSADSVDGNTTSTILSQNAESNISTLARGLSVFENIKPGGDEKKPVYILYVNPTFGGSVRLSQSLFGGSPRVSGGIIIDYKLYQINDDIGSSKIKNAGSINDYIRLQKINNNFPDNVD